MRMKYEFKHGTISLKTGTISLKSVKEVVRRSWLNMANESDYESDAVRKIAVRKEKKKINTSHKSGRLNLGPVAQIWATEPWSSRTNLCD